MITIGDACKIALQEIPGYQIVSASEVETGWIFSFALPNGDVPDMSPLFVSKETGRIESYVFEEHIDEVLLAKPIDLFNINLVKNKVGIKWL